MKKLLIILLIIALLAAMLVGCRNKNDKIDNNTEESSSSAVVDNNINETTAESEDITEKETATEGKLGEDSESGAEGDTDHGVETSEEGESGADSETVVNGETDAEKDTTAKVEITTEGETAENSEATTNSTTNETSEKVEIGGTAEESTTTEATETTDTVVTTETTEATDTTETTEDIEESTTAVDPENCAHHYDGPCDEKCDKCGDIREIKHVYDNGCDTACNECSAVRVTEHVDDDGDMVCDVCGRKILSESDYESIDAFVEYFNDYLNGALSRDKRDSITSNVRFENISYSGTLAADNQYKSITSYDGIRYYVSNDGTEYYSVIKEDGRITLVYENGEYYVSNTAPSGKNMDGKCPLPMITRNDITVSVDGKLEISDEYMQRLYTAWIDSDIASSWKIGQMSINYDELTYWMQYSKFSTTVSWDNGVMSAYDIVLESYGRTVYAFNFASDDEMTVVNMRMDVGRVIESEFKYCKGENGYATLDVKYEYTAYDRSDETFFARVDVISGVEDFVRTDKFNAAVKEGEKMLNVNVALTEKYSGEFTFDDDCMILACYDEEYDRYVLFQKSSKTYAMFGILNESVENYQMCVVAADLNAKTLTIVQHNKTEMLDIELAAKYEGQYTIAPEGDYMGAIAYDDEYETYLVFVNSGNVFVYYGHTKEVNEEILAMVPQVTVNTADKVLNIIE